VDRRFRVANNISQYTASHTTNRNNNNNRFFEVLPISSFTIINWVKFPMNALKLYRMSEGIGPNIINHRTRRRWLN
jgi:hypothetical protein